MNEKRCGTCEHYDTEHAYYKLHPGFGICNGIGDVSDSRSMDVEPDTDVAFMAATGGALFICRPDFGCVLWEERKAGDE
jgi:hypothetical protein